MHCRQKGLCRHYAKTHNTGYTKNMHSSRTRVAVIGPILPFRGGIAHHTTMLTRALNQRAEVLTLSFVRQYPRWLFPGETDLDPTHAKHREPGTEYLLDSLNPFSWREAARKTIAFNPTIVLIPWWTFFFGPMLAYLGRSLRRQSIVVVFFCHNVLDHEHAEWKKLVTRWALNQGTRFVVHTRCCSTWDWARRSTDRSVSSASACGSGSSSRRRSISSLKVAGGAGYGVCFVFIG